MSEEYEIYRHHIGDAPAVPRGTLTSLALLIGAPTAFLVAQTLRYMLVGPACEIGSARVLLEVSTLLALAGAGVVTWYGWRGIDRRPGMVPPDASAQPRFIGMVGLLLGGGFLLAGAALWVPSLFLSPCGRP